MSTAPQAEGEPVAVTGIGLFTPVGDCAAQTLTSIRAGINRFREWPQLGIEFDDGGGPAPFVASFIEEVAGACWAERAEELAADAFPEALFDAKLWSPDEVTRAYRRNAVSVFLATPPVDRPGCPGELVESFREDFVDGCREELGTADVTFVPGGQTAGILALREAARSLRERRADVGMVGAIDSLLDVDYLESLLLLRKLKTPATTEGLIPSEGAVFVVLERLADARRRGCAAQATLLDFGTGSEPIPFDGPDPNQAAGLSRAVRPVVEAGRARGVTFADVYTDLNGERGRFREWGLAEARCLFDLPHGWRRHHPADCTGDLGTAAGLFLAAVSARALHGGSARGSGVLVCATSDGGDRACASLASVASGKAS